MKFRRHYKLLIAVMIMFVGTIGLFGSARVIPYTVSADTYEQDLQDISNSLLTLGREDNYDIFDESDTLSA